MGQNQSNYWEELERRGEATRAGFRSLVRTLPLPLGEPPIPPHVKLISPGTRARWPRWVSRPTTRVDTGCERLEWSWDEHDQNPYMERLPEALTAFLKIGDGPSDDFGARVLSFAQRWGVLALCHVHRAPV